MKWDANLYYRCDGPNDDPFRACFGCEENTNENRYFNKYLNQPSYTYNNLVDRQTGETFRATQQSRRLICVDRLDRSSCRIRIDRAMEMRDITYMRALRLIQSEEYLSAEDFNLVRYYFV